MLRSSNMPRMMDPACHCPRTAANRDDQRLVGPAETKLANIVVVLQ
jgi:hypothetical protein